METHDIPLSLTTCPEIGSQGNHSSNDIFIHYRKGASGAKSHQVTGLEDAPIIFTVTEQCFHSPLHYFVGRNKSSFLLQKGAWADVFTSTAPSRAKSTHNPEMANYKSDTKLGRIFCPPPNPASPAMVLREGKSNMVPPLLDLRTVQITRDLNEGGRGHLSHLKRLYHHEGNLYEIINHTSSVMYIFVYSFHLIINCKYRLNQSS